MDRIFDLLAVLPNTSMIIRLKLMLAGMGAMIAGCAVMGIEGSGLRGAAIAACGAILLGIVALSPEAKREPAAPPEDPPETRPESSCEHDWVDQDEMSHHDPMHLRCSKCGESLFV